MTTIDFFIELHKRKPFGLTKEVLFFEACIGEPTPPKNLQLKAVNHPANLVYKS